MSTPLFERWTDSVKNLMLAKLPAFIPNMQPYKDELPHTLKYLWVVHTKLTCLIAFHYLADGQFDVSVGWTDQQNSRYVWDPAAKTEIPDITQPQVWVRVATLANRASDPLHVLATEQGVAQIILQAIDEIKQHGMPYLHQKIDHVLAQGRPLPSASFIPYSKMPTRDYLVIGTCNVSMDAVLEKTRAKPYRRKPRWDALPYRMLVIELSNGHCATAMQFDQSPTELWIELEVFQKYVVSRADLTAVARLLQLAPETINVRGNCLRWRD